MTISTQPPFLPQHIHPRHLRPSPLWAPPSISRSNGVFWRATEQAGPGDRRYRLLVVADANVQWKQMTHAPFIPLREAKNRDVGCQGEFKGNPSAAVSTERIREQREEDGCCTFRRLRWSCGAQSSLVLPMCHQLASKRKQPFGVASPLSETSWHTLDKCVGVKGRCLDHQ